MEDNKHLSFGWLPDLPDFRDFNENTESIPARISDEKNRSSISQLTARIGLKPEQLGKSKLPALQNLRPWCSPVENQEELGACTAHAGVGLIEYFERRAYNNHIDASRLFLYKTTRNLLNWTGDTGAYLRTTMAALALFGVPPEKYWKYDVRTFDVEPSAFCYSFGQNYQILQYYRLDGPGTDPVLLLDKIRTHLAAGLPLVFGFTVYQSMEQSAKTGEIPFPCRQESILGGHAVMATGYDEDKIIKNENCSQDTKGALMIRNSWGTSWGDAGYGWLPYDYVLKGLAVDWWTLIKAEWVDLGIFNLKT